MGSAEAAKRLGMTVQALGHWIRSGAPVRDGKRGREFCWPDFPRWKDREIERKAKESSRPKTMDEARQRREAAEAEIAELDLEERRGTIALKSVVQAAVSADYARVRARLLSLPAKAAPFCVGLKTQTEAQMRLEPLMDEVIRELQGDASP